LQQGLFSGTVFLSVRWVALVCHYYTTQVLITWQLKAGLKNLKQFNEEIVESMGSSLFCMGNSISRLSSEADYVRGMLNVERP
jgi:hypothetical protein